jgi:uncharacterized membrane protein
MGHNQGKFAVAIKAILRVLLVTAIFALIGFAIGLFCGIAASILYGAMRGVHPDMTMAYKFVALPFGLAALVITLVVMIVTEIRHVRRPLEFSRHSTLPRTS